jgi:hypothetical protein
LATEDLRQDVSIGVTGEIGFPYHAITEKKLHRRMVARELEEVLRTPTVHTGVANMRDNGLPPGEPNSSECRPHPRLGGVGLTHTA